jgi:hypothetical protein
MAARRQFQDRGVAGGKMVDFIFEFLGRILLEIVWAGIWQFLSFIFGGIWALIRLGVGTVLDAVASISGRSNKQELPPPTDDQTGQPQ